MRPCAAFARCVTNGTTSLVRLYVDTNALIAAIEGQDLISDMIRQLLETAGSGRTTFVTSEITLAELLVGPLRSGDAERAEAMLSIVNSGSLFDVMPVDRGVILRAADLRAAYPALKLPDALHLATALTQHCPLMLSSDRRLPDLDGLGYVRLEEAPLRLVLEAARAW